MTVVRLVGIVAALAFMLAGARAEDAAQSGPYRLGVGDEIRLTVQDQPQVSGQSTIVDDGTLAMPLLDRLPLAGLTLREASDAIRQRLAVKIVDPMVAVEVSRYRPFFILGDVANPGLYPWFPGATVAQAIAVAGGYRGKSDYLQSAVAAIRATEALAVARYQLDEARVQDARLRLELDGKTVLTPPSPDSPADIPLIKGIVAREQVIMDVRTTGFAKQLELLKREQEIRGDELTPLDARIKAQARQDDSLRNEIRDIQALIARGLAPTSRLNDLNREVNRLQNDTMQTQLQINQARNGRNQAELQVANLTRERRLQLLAESQEIAGRMQRLRQQLRAESSIVLEAGAQQGQPGGESVVTTFRLQTKGAASSRAADENMGIMPGDVLRVNRVLTSAPGQTALDCETPDKTGACPPCVDGACASPPAQPRTVSELRKQTP